ncbi:hypothetical protein WI67_27925 [Burkholderia cepacia]|nr:hypothetical protein WI67_27925 [Burkholderia cepacia]
MIVAHDRGAQYVQWSRLVWTIRVDFEYGTAMFGDDKLLARCLDELKVFECTSVEFRFRNGSVRHHGMNAVM